MWKKIFEPEKFLRLGLGIMYLYSGTDIIRHPSAWYWTIRQLPDAVEAIPNAIGLNRFLTVHGNVELVFAAVFLLWFFPKRAVLWVAVFSALEMTAILALVGVDAITFRDIGLLGASLALSAIMARRGAGGRKMI